MIKGADAITYLKFRQAIYFFITQNTTPSLHNQTSVPSSLDGSRHSYAHLYTIIKSEIQSSSPKKKGKRLTNFDDYKTVENIRSRKQGGLMSCCKNIGYSRRMSSENSAANIWEVFVSWQRTYVAINIDSHRILEKMTLQ